MSARDRLARYRASRGAPEARIAATADSGAYSGTPDLPIEEAPWYADPLNFIPVPGAQTNPGLALGRVASEAAGPVAQMAGNVARPVLGGIGGALAHTPLIGPMIRGAARGFRAGLPAIEREAAPALQGAATAAEMQPLVGRAEAAAFQRGGMSAVEAERAIASRVEDPASSAGRELARKRWGTKPEVIEGKSAGQQRIARLKEGESAPGRAKRLRQRQKDNRRNPQLQQQPQIETPALGGELQRAIAAEKWMVENGVTPEQRIEILRRLAQGE